MIDALTQRRTTIGGHGLGLVPDLPDVRDFLFRPKKITLPPEVRLDLAPAMPPVYDQGQLGSCVGNGVSGAFEFDLRNQHARDFRPSRLFVYYGARYIEGTVAQDAGANIRDGVKVVASLGAPSERSWPYKIDKFADRPPDSAFKAASSHTITKYERVSVNATAFRTALAGGRPIVFGITLYDSFESAPLPAGVVPDPGPGEAVLGGHCMAVVGYATVNGKPYFRVRNSWGKGWADKGYCWISEAYLTGRSVSDCWVLTTVSG